MIVQCLARSTQRCARRTLTLPAGAAALGGLLFACTGDAPRTAGAIDADAVPTLVLVEQSRLGSIDDTDYGFSRVGDVDVDRDGNLYVFESQDRQIRVYGGDGKLLRRIGGRGGGPGEFGGSLVQFAVTGDTIWTFESSNRRLTFFDLDGRVLSTAQVEDVDVPMYVEGQTVTVIPYSLRADGYFIGDRGGSSMMSTGPGHATRLSDTMYIPRVRFDQTGKVVDTVGTYPVPRSTSSTEYIDVGRSRYIKPQPPSDESLDISIPDGSIRIERNAAQNGSRALFRVTRLDFGGDTVNSQAFQYSPLRYPDVVLDSFVMRRIRGSGRTSVFTETGIDIIEKHAADSAAALGAGVAGVPTARTGLSRRQ